MDRISQSQGLVRPAGRYNDVLGLAPFRDGQLIPHDLETISRQLSLLGYSVSETAPGHWVLTFKARPGQVHLYSPDELAFFAARSGATRSAQACHPIICGSRTAVTNVGELL